LTQAEPHRIELRYGFSMGGGFSASKDPLNYRISHLPPGRLKDCVKELQLAAGAGIPYPNTIDLSGVSLDGSTSCYGTEGMELLAAFLSQNKTVQRIRYTVRPPPDVTHLTSSFQSICSLSRCELHMQELCTLSKAIKTHPKLQILDISKNALTSEVPDVCA
jgi:hypothetical protein